jgi:hypothetical protein
MFARSSSRLECFSMTPRESHHPPSDPRPARMRSSGDGFPAEDRPARAQLVATTLVGLALVASGLYLWRRPRTPPDAGEAAPTSASALAVEDARSPAALADAGSSSAVTVSEPRVVGCHDRGSRKTPAEQCDHVVTVEQALAQAIEQSATCGASSASGGTIEYLADVSFLRRKVRVTLPASGRSLRDRRVAVACATAVREAMQSVPLDAADHQHARYQISVTATYRGKIHG